MSWKPPRATRYIAVHGEDGLGYGPSGEAGMRTALTVMFPAKAAKLRDCGLGESDVEDALDRMHAVMVVAARESIRDTLRRHHATTGSSLSTLSVRGRRVCESQDVTSVEELANFGRGGFKGVRNCGPTTVEEFERLLRKYGLEWAL